MDTVSERPINSLHPYGIAVDSARWHNAIRNCVQEQRHLGRSPWLRLPAAAKFALRRCPHYNIFKEVFEASEPPARLNLALILLTEELERQAQPQPSSEHNMTDEHGNAQQSSQHTSAQLKACFLPDADAVLCSLLFAHTVAMVLVNSAGISASAPREITAGLCSHLEHDLVTVRAMVSDASAQHLSFNSELLEVSVSQTMLYLRREIKHGAGSVYPCMRLLRIVAICATAKVPVADQLVKQGEASLQYLY